MLNQDSKIYVAGHTGLIGTALTQRLQEKGYKNLLFRSHKDLDLTCQAAVEKFFEENRPEFVIMNAAMPANSVNVRTNPVGVMLNNTAMIQNVFSAAMKFGVKKMLYVCSVACYPSDAEVKTLQDGGRVIYETAMRPGRIDKLSERYYAMPKLLGREMCRVFNESGKMRCATVIVPHAYGYSYHYEDPQRLPVYPSLVKRFCDGAKSGAKEVVIWGSGNLHREFTHVNDLADGYIMLLDSDDATGDYNIGSGRMVSIRTLAEHLKEITGFRGEIVFDTTKPDAIEFPLLGTDKLRALGWEPKVAFEDGVKMSCDYYRKNYG